MVSERSVVGVDVGGTFTDCVAWSPGGVSVAKVATTEDESEAVITGADRLTGGHVAQALFHGTTVATNTLLERRGADTVLITDPGFEDVIEIGRQDRPSLYDSFADRPPPLVARQDRFGSTDPEEVADWVIRRRPESVAVSFAYSFADPDDESAVAAALDGTPVSVSHRVAPEFREFERASTTVLNAYLQPRLGGYMQRLTERAETVTEHLQIMRSSGGLMQADDAAGLAAALLLSGPAGGVVAAAALGRAHDYGRLITFDMGGTSTDVCRIEDDRPEVAYERTIDGYVCRMPSVAVDTVGAGGGSLAWKDAGGSLRVGPRSAGARPGPVAYGLGGTEPTVTDAHVVLGRIDPDARLGGLLPLDADAARQAMEVLGSRFGFEASRAAEGIIEVVEAHMERAIRNVSVEQGADPRIATLVAFGGAGGLHATALARRLDMASVAVPPYAGVFSALGLLMAPPRLDAARSVSPTAPYWSHLEGLAKQASTDYLAANGSSPERVERRVDMRYRGQSHEISVAVEPGDSPESLEERFHALHHEMNGFARPDDPVEVVTVRAVAEGASLLGWEDLPRLGEGPLPTPRRRTVTIRGSEVTADVWWRPDLPAGGVLSGPAVIEEDVGTTLLLPGDRARVAADGTLEVTLT